MLNLQTVFVALFQMESSMPVATMNCTSIITSAISSEKSPMHFATRQKLSWQSHRLKARVRETLFARVARERLKLRPPRSLKYFTSRLMFQSRAEPDSFSLHRRLRKKIFSFSSFFHGPEPWIEGICQPRGLNTTMETQKMRDFLNPFLPLL